MQGLIQILCGLFAMAGLAIFAFMKTKGNRGGGMGGMGGGGVGGLAQKLTMGTTIFLFLFAVAPTVVGMIIFGIADIAILAVVGAIKAFANLINIR
jgi:hypothetical protein